MVRRHIYFSGRVQGVGFRFQASWAAKRLDLTGWVRNLDDGRVEMEVQGDEASMERLVERLHQGRFIRIERMETEMIPVIKESSFREIY